ncbi:aldehyde dehydrogenase family protein [Prauserella oleivorans]
MDTQDTSAAETVAALVARARAAQAVFEDFDQQRVDDVVAGAAWAIYRPDRARELAEIAVRDTGLGNAEDKVAKNQRKTLGTLRDLTGVKSVGVIREDPATGITEYAKPVGVVAAVCPSTNPAATPANKTMMALKGRNAVILSPSPKGASTCRLLVEYIHAELDKVGAPRDLVQYVAEPSKALTNELMSQADLVVVTGSQRNVRQAYRSGTPAIGVGAGNAPVIVDADADIADAAEKIRRSKTFDYATSCSSENSVHIHDTVYDATLRALEDQGGYLLTSEEKERLAGVMWPNGKLSPAVTAQPPGKLAALAGLDSPAARSASFFMVQEEGSVPSTRSVARSCRWCSPSTGSGGSTTRSSGSSSCSTTRARDIPAGSTPAARSTPGWSPSGCGWRACWSTRPTASVPAEASTTVSASPSRWAPGPGRATASATTCPTGISSTSRGWPASSRPAFPPRNNCGAATSKPTGGDG